jgi:hypothetical protein
MVESFSILRGLAGGILIGLGAAVLLLLNGKIAGISGILGGMLGSAKSDLYWRIAFVIGILAGGFLTPLITGDALVTTLPVPWWLIIPAGLLVGFGTRLGSGCTSGHGVCGLARLSGRSLAATMTFIVVAMVTVFVVRHILGI